MEAIMETFGEYLLSEKNFGKKVEIVSYLKKNIVINRVRKKILQNIVGKVLFMRFKEVVLLEWGGAIIRLLLNMIIKFIRYIKLNISL